MNCTEEYLVSVSSEGTIAISRFDPLLQQLFKVLI